MNPFVERHQASISSTLSCFDRVVVTGTLPDICHPKAMAGFLDYHKVRLFDFPRWAEPLREELRENAEQIAAEAGLRGAGVKSCNVTLPSLYESRLTNAEGIQPPHVTAPSILSCEQPKRMWCAYRCAGKLRPCRGR